MNLFNLSLRLSGYNIQRAVKDYQILKKAYKKNCVAYQEQYAWAIYDYHKTNTSFYKQLLKGKKISQWSDIPILTKEHLQQPLQDRLSHTYTIHNSHVHKTSGSGGHPFIFAKDKPAHALTWAMIQDEYSDLGLDVKHAIEARFYGVTPSKIKQYKELFKDKLGNRYRFPVFNLTQEQLAQFVTVFRKKKFSYINGYTSVIVFFAKYLREKNIVLKDVCPTLTHCIVTAEMLFPNDLKLIQEQLGVPVYNEYGSSETSIIALGNAGTSLPIVGTQVLVEVVDDSYQPVPEGEVGNLLVTSFFNKAHPFIRYKIGDRGAIAQGKNNTPVLHTLEGRTGEFAYFPNGKIVPGLRFYYLTKKVMDATSNVKEFIIIQKSISVFEIQYVAQQELSAVLLKHIREEFYTIAESMVTVHILHKPYLSRNQRGKLKQFYSELKD